MINKKRMGVFIAFASSLMTNKVYLHFPVNQNGVLRKNANM